MIKTHKIMVLPGDGIGPEIMEEAVKVLRVAEGMFGLELMMEYGLIGGAALDVEGVALPPATVDRCRWADAVLLGSIGGPQWDSLPLEERPEIGGLLKLRNELNLFANIRPVVLYENLKKISPLSQRVITGKIDLVTVRELAGGIYFGKPKVLEDDLAYDTMMYRASEVERIARIAFDTAKTRRQRVTSIDKSNVLSSSVLWRQTVQKVAQEYPEIELLHMYVDNAAMQLILNPSQFDVILTSNLFGDILSDESAAITNSLGLLPSASLGEKIHLFEPAGGSAPDIAGRGIANPVAQILSAALMFDYSFDRKDIGAAIFNSVKAVINRGYKTVDIASDGEQVVSTSEFGDRVCRELKTST